MCPCRNWLNDINTYNPIKNVHESEIDNYMSWHDGNCDQCKLLDGTEYIDRKIYMEDIEEIGNIIEKQKLQVLME